MALVLNLWYHVFALTAYSLCLVPGGTVRDSMGISLGNLPPSLKPPPEGGYPPLPFIDWG